MMRLMMMGWVVVAALAPPVALADMQRRVTIYYAPETNLEEIDIGILNQASPGVLVNFAAYVLSDYRVIDALRMAASRGVKVRIYLDPRETQQLKLSDKHPLVRLSRTQNVVIKVKSEEEGLMHLKGYSIGDAILRTGSANDSVAGLSRQDNDLVLISERDAAQSFNHKFDVMWARPTNISFEHFFDAALGRVDAAGKEDRSVR